MEVKTHRSMLSAALAMLACAAVAAGAGATAPTAGEVRTLSERVPAGGTVQVKYLLTQVRPITSGGPKLYTFGFDVLGVSAFSPLGDTAGAALVSNGVLSVSILSPSADYGTNADYPFMTVAMAIPASTKSGSTFPLEILEGNYLTPSGPLTLTDPKPGTLTIGGSISISGVFPGGGTWAPGTVISIRGAGFRPTTKITTKMRSTNAVYVSQSEMRVSLIQTTTLDSQPFTASNTDGSQSTFYSYLRGTPVSVPSRELLRKTDPIFQTITHGFGSVGPTGNLTSGQFAALAIQNPNPGPVAVSFTLASTGLTTSVILPSCTRIVDELGQLLGGIALPADDQVIVRATAGVQILGLLGDESAGTITPFLPNF